MGEEKEEGGRKEERHEVFRGKPRRSEVTSALFSHLPGVDVWFFLSHHTIAAHNQHDVSAIESHELTDVVGAQFRIGPLLDDLENYCTAFASPRKYPSQE